jgi:hypothetical protein
MALKPYRQYSEYNVINGLFNFTNASQAEAGTIVKAAVDPIDGEDDLTDIIGSLTSVPNAQALLFGPVGSVEIAGAWNGVPRPLGVILKSVASVDENEELLQYNPRKAAEMDVILPDSQAVPILTHGILYLNNIDTADHTPALGGDPEPGDTAYVGDNGAFATDGIVPVGQFLSAPDNEGYVLIRIGF